MVLVYLYIVGVNLSSNLLMKSSDVEHMSDFAHFL